MYALSTLVMNHRAHFSGEQGPGPGPMTIEREFVYDGVFSEGVTLRDQSEQILASLGIDGAHTASRTSSGAVVIMRNDLMTPRRVTYTPADQKVAVEVGEVRPNAVLERFHRRRGYRTGYILDTVWAVTVDLVIAALVVWAVSGVWMWWRMKTTRRAGFACGLAGLALFVVFLVTI